MLVLRTDNGMLYPRLQGRCYSEKKLSENMEAEIMQVILDEARESYKEEIVIELRSDTIEVGKSPAACVPSLARRAQAYRLFTPARSPRRRILSRMCRASSCGCSSG